MGHLLGIGLILISAACFGAMAIFGKFASASGISTHSLLFFRFLIAALVMTPIALLQKRRFPKGRDLVILTAMGFIGYAGVSFCYFTALNHISPGLLAILLYLYPVMVAGLSFFFLKESFTRNKVLALVLAVSGAVLVIGLDTEGNRTGVLLGISAAVIYAFYNVAGGSVMGRNDAFTASLVVIASSGFFYFIYNLRAGFFIPGPGIAWLHILAIALISTALAIYTYFQGMKLAGAVNASMLSTFEPVTTVGLAAVFLGQPIGWMQAAGTALILSSAILVALRPKPKESFPEQTESSAKGFES
jgi:drug/metabolite transporter (DMT)-like permease